VGVKEGVQELQEAEAVRVRTHASRVRAKCKLTKIEKAKSAHSVTPELLNSCNS
jgi:hypothetical protein